MPACGVWGTLTIQDTTGKVQVLEFAQGTQISVDMEITEDRELKQ